MTADVAVRPVTGCSDLLRLHHAWPARYPYLLESVAHGTAQGRFDILFAFPQETLQLQHLEARAHETFLDGLDRWYASEREIDGEAAPTVPFRGGWFVYLGYELAAQVEPRLQLPGVDRVLPAAFARRIPAAIVRDHAHRRCVLVAEPGCEDFLDAMAEDVRTAPALPLDARGALVERVDEDDPDAFVAGVHRILDYIREGDVFQVNLSRAWRARLDGTVDDSTLYTRLRKRNPAPFAGLVAHGGAVLMSSSPERLVDVHGRQVQTRPIAGTRPRGGNRDADAALSCELLAHAKERAEHIMLVDLERNDLGRVCIPGSIEVDELMALESYAHVHHIVSNVTGRLRAGTTPGEVIAAVFPGGTITGCPKVRCMEIIAELENVPRGPYTGSMGYLNRDGDMDLNILIRTLLRAGDTVSLRAGAGIVADSMPEQELAETRAKARGLLLALEAQEQGR